MMGIVGCFTSRLHLLDFLLRVLIIIPFNVASIWITIVNEDANPTYGRLGFHNLVGLKYMVCISSISAGYALFAALSSFICFPCPPNKPWLFFLTDQMTAYLVVTSMAAQVEFFYLAYHGDGVTWSRACASYGGLCIKLRLVLALHTIVVCCFLVLAVISAYRVFKRFEPPVVADDNTTQ